MSIHEALQSHLERAIKNWTKHCSFLRSIYGLDDCSSTNSVRLVPKVRYSIIKKFNAPIFLLKIPNINLQWILFPKVGLHIQLVQVIPNLLFCFISCKLNPYWVWNKFVDPSDCLWIVFFPGFQLSFIFPNLFIYWFNRGSRYILSHPLAF